MFGPNASSNCLNAGGGDEKASGSILLLPVPLAGEGQPEPGGFSKLVGPLPMLVGPLAMLVGPAPAHIGVCGSQGLVTDSSAKTSLHGGKGEVAPGGVEPPHADSKSDPIA